MEKKKNKLRRSRVYKDADGIETQIQSVTSPESRRARKAEAKTSSKVVPLASFPQCVREEDFGDKIVCGDSAKALACLPDEVVTCVVTSPPYWNQVDYGVDAQIGPGSYQDYRDGLLAVWKQVARVMKPNAKFVLNVPLLPIRKDVSKKEFGETHTRVVLDLYSDLKDDILKNTDLILYSLYIWEKQTTEKMFGSYPFPPNLYERNYIEFMAVFVKPGAPEKVEKKVKEGARLSQSEWMELTKQIWWMYPENVGRKKGHPAPFPEILPNRFINMYSFPSVEGTDHPGDLVLDPFSGWGTTCVAAKRLGRRYLGIDLNPEFCNHAASRLRATERVRVVYRAENKKQSQMDLFGS